MSRDIAFVFRLENAERDAASMVGRLGQKQSLVIAQLAEEDVRFFARYCSTACVRSVLRSVLGNPKH